MFLFVASTFERTEGLSILENQNPSAFGLEPNKSNL